MADDPEIIAQHLLASALQENIKAYLERGRYLAPLDDRAVTAVYIREYEKWANGTSLAQAHRELEDVQAEFSLRGLPEPREEVEQAFEKLRTRLLRATTQADLDNLAEALRPDVMRVFDQKKRPN